MEHHVVTEKLYLASGAVQVSQGIPNNGNANAIYVYAWIESGGAVTSNDVDIEVQESFDLDTWTTNTSVWGGSITTAPGKVSFGTTSPGYSSLKAPFVRLKYTNNLVIDVILGAEVRLLQL